MSQPLVFPSPQSPAESLLKRRGDRVSMDTPISVRGLDAHGDAFGEQASTVLLSRLGATISLKRTLLPGALITVRNLALGCESPCRVVARLGEQSNGYLYGVSLMDPTVNLWGISFPPLAKGKNAAARLLLRCAACRSSEVVYMDEMEAEIFAANASLSRFCSDCQSRTIWLAGTAEAEPNTLSHTKRRSTNERALARVQAHLRTCIRQPGFGDELLFSENLSRGGLSFKSPNHYYSGSVIHVAIPYFPGNGNVFVPARIVYARPTPAEGCVHHGATYIQSR